MISSSELPLRLEVRYQVVCAGSRRRSVVTQRARTALRGPKCRNASSATHQVSSCPSRKCRLMRCQPARGRSRTAFAKEWASSARAHPWLQVPSQWSAIGSIAAKIGCTAETLRKWVRQAERDQGLRAGPTTAEQERIKVLERENRELRQVNEILRKASAYFAMAELDRRSKP